MDFDKGWIWHPDWDESRAASTAGGFVHFRKNFAITNVPAKPVLVHISADTRYKLYVNSQFVSYGPVKGDEHLWFYDELDIQPFLKPGVNTVAVRVLRFYHATFYATSFVRLPLGGLFIRGATASKDINIDGDERWETAIDLSTRLPVNIPDDDFLHVYESVDRRRDNHLKWVPAAPHKLFSAFGLAAPWKLSHRLIPRQRLEPKRFVGIHNLESTVQPQEWETALLYPHDGSPVIQLPAGTRHHVELEVEHHMTAFLYFRFLRQPATGSSLEITYSECYEDTPKQTPYARCKDDRRDTTKSIYGPKDVYAFGGINKENSVLDIQYHPRGETEEIFAPYHFRTLRFIAVDIVVGKGSDLALKGIDIVENTYPMQRIADISVSADQEAATSARKLWTTSIQTLQNCMHDCYEDCPFYEQLQYSMDMRSSALFTYSLSGDDRLARQAIIQHHNSFQADVGLTAGRAPSHQLQIIPNFSLYWICMVTDHYEHYGDVRFARRFLGAVDSILGTFDRRINPAFGLVGPPENSRQWDFVDWTDKWKPRGVPPASQRTGFQTFSSLLYAYTLRRAAVLLAALERPGLAAEYGERADAIVKAVQTHCFDGQFFTDGLASQADLNVDYSQHSQIWAVLGGAVSGNTAAELLDAALGGSTSPHDFSPPSIAMRFYSLRALSVAGGNVYNDHFHAFWDLWRKQLSKNVTTWVEDSVSERSDCHAWGSAPLYEFTAEVAGVRPAKPAWAAISFKPRLILFPEFDAKVPIGGEAGSVVVVAHVKWNREADGRFKVSLELEAGAGQVVDVPVLVTFPNGEEKSVQANSEPLLFDVVLGK